MGITASNSIVSHTKDTSTNSAAAAQPSSGHGATVPASEQAPAPAQQQPGDIKG